jgi:hypothetical protein
LAISSLLVACGGGIEPAPGLSASVGGSGGGGGGSGCVTGAAPTVLTWDAVAVAAGYRIYFGTSPANYLQASGVDVGNVTTTPVMGLSGGTTYYFAVTAYDGSNNESILSTEVCKTIS